MLPLLAIALLAAACGGGSTPTVHRADLEQQISSRLQKQVGQAPDGISCPGDLKGKVGTTMRCTLTAGSDKLGVSVKVTSVEGSDVNYSYAVDQTKQSGAAS